MLTGVLDSDGAKTPISVQVDQSIISDGNSPEVMRRILRGRLTAGGRGAGNGGPAPIFALRVPGPAQV